MGRLVTFVATFTWNVRRTLAVKNSRQRFLPNESNEYGTEGKDGEYSGGIERRRSEEM